MEVAAPAISSRTPGLNWSRGGARKTLTTAVLVERWELVQNQTRLWLGHLRRTTSFRGYWQGLDRPYYFVSLCLNCVSVLTGGVTANGFKLRIQGDGEAKLCACHLSVVTVPLFLSVDTLNCNIMVVFWHDSSMCIVCLYILWPIHALLQPDCSLMGEFQDIMNFELWVVWWTSTFRNRSFTFWPFWSCWPCSSKKNLCTLWSRGAYCVPEAL